MPADDPNALLLYRLAEQEKALKEALAEIKEFKKDQKSESKTLRDELAKDISDKFAHHDKRITEIIRNVSLYGAFVPIFLVLIGAAGAWFTIKSLHSEITYETQAWLNGYGKGTVTQLVEKVTNDYLSSEAGQKKLKEAVSEKLTPLAEIAIKEFNAQIEHQRSLFTSTGASPAIALSPETQKALDAVKNQPDDQRSPDAWRALIYSYLGTKSYETALALTNRWLASSRQTPEHTAEALVLKGNALLNVGRSQEALGAYDAVIQRFGTDANPALRKLVANALVSKGVSLYHSSPPRHVAEIAVYDDVIQRFGTDPDPFLREQVARALLYKGNALIALSPPEREKAITAYEAVVQRFGSDHALREQVANALVAKGAALFFADPQKHEAEIAAYDEVIQRFGADPAPALRKLVASALFNRGNALSGLTPPRRDDEIAAYDEVILRFGSDPALRELVAMALRSKGFTLQSGNKPGLAKTTYEEYLRRFANAPEPAIQEITTQVRARLAALK